MESKKPTIKDIARIAGVSSATVSYVMNDLGKVTPEVDAHVRRVAFDLGYKRNQAARALKTGRNNLIGCLVPSLLSPVFPEIASAVQHRAEERGFATFVIDAGRQGHRREEESLRILAKHGADGAVAVLGSRPCITEPPQFPIVAIDQPIPGLDSVRADHYHGAELIARHAIALGHRDVGLLIGDPALFSSRERREGFLAAARGALNIRWEIPVPLTPSLPEEAVSALRRRDVTLIVCVNDLIAMATLSALHQQSVRVPEEVSVVGFDDMQWAAWPLLNLTTVRQPLAELGHRAVDLLLDRLDEPQRPTEDLILPVSLMARGSMCQVDNESLNG